MKIIIDSREKCPYKFPAYDCIVKGLKTGDYSIEGCEDEVALERKSREDAYGSIGQNRDRFECELIRLAAMKYAAIIIESSLRDFLIPPPYSAIHQNSAIGSLLSWSVQYRLPVFFCGDRAHAMAVTLKLLEKFYKHREEIIRGKTVD